MSIIIIIIIDINYLYMSSLVVSHPAKNMGVIVEDSELYKPLRNQIQYFINIPHVCHQIALLFLLFTIIRITYHLLFPSW